MSADRELLGLAAKAAGFTLTWQPGWGGMADWPLADGDIWNPLTSDRDALRLAVKLRLEMNVEDYGASARSTGGRWYGCEAHIHGGIEAATRRAIVRAAAEIGRGMP